MDPRGEIYGDCCRRFDFKTGFNLWNGAHVSMWRPQVAGSWMMFGTNIGNAFWYDCWSRIHALMRQTLAGN